LRSSRWRRAPLRQDRRVLQALLAKLALPVRLVRQALRAHKASRDPSVHRALSASAGRLALPARPDRSDRRARREKPVAKAQSDPVANADHQGLRAPLARPARQARRVTPARHRQFAWSPVPIAFVAETTKSWLVSFARAVRPRARSARHLARQQPVYVYGGDLVSAARGDRRPALCLGGAICSWGVASWPPLG
jgi:hypothetical protein